MRARASAALPDRRWRTCRDAISPTSPSGAGPRADARRQRARQPRAAARMTDALRAPDAAAARPAAARRLPLLSVSQLTKHFPIRRGLFGRDGGAVRAVDGVSLRRRARRDVRHRRRIGLRQDDARPLHPPSHRADVRPDPLRRHRRPLAGRHVDAHGCAVASRSSSRIRFRRSTRA